MAKPLVMLLTRVEDGKIKNVPFVYRDGSMLEIVEAIAELLVAHGLECPFWEGIAADRLRIILEQNQMLNAARELLETQKDLIAKLKAEVMPGALAQ